MIQNSLLFTTKFNVVPTVPKFVLTDTTDYASEGISLTNVNGVFKIEGPSGIIYNNTNFGAPDIIANVSLVFGTVSLPLDTNGDILKGNYSITYTILVSGGVQAGTYLKTTTSYFCYEPPAGKVEVTNSVRLAKVTSKDLTPYNIGAIVPTITRSHKLYYPSVLAIPPTTSSSDTIILSYPSVYTGTYAGEVITTASYVFTDGLIVDYLIRAVDETIVDNKTLCDIYCGIKNLTNEMLAAKSTGDFGKAGQIEETLSLVAILFDLYDGAITCGKEADAENWLNQIISLANITVGCGCTDDEPQLVIPEGGGSGSGDTVVVEGDASFGTAVASATVGDTTTYTVRLTQAYKDLILGALQSQDLSVAAFRAAGIPEEGRGVSVVPMSGAGGLITFTVGLSPKMIVVTGSPTLSANLAIEIVGTPMDGDSFIVDYRATVTPNGNGITIFGLPLSDTDIAAGNSLVYTWYAASTATWYSKLISNNQAGTSQDGLFFWETGPDYALDEPVLYGSNPSFIYTNILELGSGANPPSGTTADNANWRYVGNKSVLFDRYDRPIIDVTGGNVLINSSLSTSIGSFEFLVLEAKEMKRKALASIPLAGFSLTSGKFIVGVAGAAQEVTINNAYLRNLGIGGITGSTFTKLILPSSGTITIDPATSTMPYVLEGTVTLLGNVSVVGNVSTSLGGDKVWIDYKAVATLGGNTLTILGVAISAADALAGNFGIYGYFDSFLGIWVGRKISYNVALPIGTTNQTVRYNASNVLEADPNVTHDSSGNLVAKRSVSTSVSNIMGIRSIVAGEGNEAGTNSIVGGTSNAVTGQHQLVSGAGNTVTGAYNAVAGFNNNVNASGTIVSGADNTVVDSNALVIGTGNNASGVIAVIGNDNTGTSGGFSQIFGIGNILASSAFAGIIKGVYGRLINPYSSVFSNSSSSKIGLRQQETAIHSGQTTTGASAVLFPGGGGSFLFGNNQVHTVVVQVSAIQSAGSAGTVGDSHGFILKAAVKCVAGVYSLVGTQVVDGNIFDAAATAWTATVVANAGGFQIVVTGEVNKTIEWTAGITTVNAGY